MLGYLLRIDRLQIYDPLCRPLADDHFEGETRSGAAYSGSVPAVDAMDFETFQREGSEKVLGRITKKCNKQGMCTIMGGKTRKKKRTRKSNKRSKKTKRTRKHRRK